MLAKRGRNSLQTASSWSSERGALWSRVDTGNQENLARTSLATYLVGAPAHCSWPTLAGSLPWRSRRRAAIRKRPSTRRSGRISGELGLLRSSSSEIRRARSSDKADDRAAGTPCGALGKTAKQLVGEGRTVHSRDPRLHGQVYAATGDTPTGSRRVREATRLLASTQLTRCVDDEGYRSSWQSGASSRADYINILADIRGHSSEREAGIDATAEAFPPRRRARGRSVQRALNASAARAAAASPLCGRPRAAESGTPGNKSTMLNALLTSFSARPAIS